MPPLKISADPFKAIGLWKMETPFQDQITIEGLKIILCGLQATHPEFGTATGSSGSVGRPPSETAWFELIERMTIMENLTKELFPLCSMAKGDLAGQIARADIFPIASSPLFMHSKSNGVALHDSWEEACKRAAFELIERHLVLASWVGMTAPKVLRGSVRAGPLQLLGKIYEIQRLDFGSQAVAGFKDSIHVSGVVLLSKSGNAPLIIAFGAGFSPEESLVKAEAETLQRLGFLWGEEIPQELPAFQANNLFHQEYFLLPANRSKIEAWIAGDFLRQNAALSQALMPMDFADLTRFHDLGMYVAKAVAPNAIPLVFGQWRSGVFKDLPEDRLIHPIA